MLWLGTLLGLLVRSPDAAQGIVFMAVFPLTFLATTFVPLGGLPTVLREFAACNPISSLGRRGAQAVRQPDRACRPTRRVAARSTRCWLVAVVRRDDRDRRPARVRPFRARTTG